MEQCDSADKLRHQRNTNKDGSISLYVTACVGQQNKAECLLLEAPPRDSLHETVFIRLRIAFLQKTVRGLMLEKFKDKIHETISPCSRAIVERQQMYCSSSARAVQDAGIRKNKALTWKEISLQGVSCIHLQRSRWRYPMLITAACYPISIVPRWC